ncbi:hypothetical protein Dda_6730 [Drechslerella dactyloides]|uniref:UTP23 sensor motif region domain-containing protein n=1 Tax=Drechslerella dactyloides TaxID=74499 RepID=A0AAD6NHT5_DREDA|nr:hypothetical protein Dda_6730 [Drechslerella dactyloides]
MRGKRSKAYRKLMAVYAHSFGFREPYQVLGSPMDIAWVYALANTTFYLVDPSIIQDAAKFKMDLAAGLERTLQGKVKPNNQPLINLAKTFERRRCDHSISDPALSPLDCLLSVVIPSKDAPIPNKHRYVVATDDLKIRDEFREYPGVPGIHITRSVMVLDQMSEATTTWREREEKGKLRSGLKETVGRKRKRDDDEPMEEDSDSDSKGSGDEAGEQEEVKATAAKKKKVYGKKQPNPLSMLKKKKKKPGLASKPVRQTKDTDGQDADGVPKAKRKRKRTHAAASKLDTAGNNDSDS